MSNQRDTSKKEHASAAQTRRRAEMLSLTHNTPTKPRKLAGKANWGHLSHLASSVAQFLADMHRQFKEATEMVKTIGPVNEPEFIRVVQATNADLMRYTQEFHKMFSRHEGKTGLVMSSVHIADYLQWSQDYVSFMTDTQSVLEQSIIVLTQMALEARQAQPSNPKETQNV